LVYALSIRPGLSDEFLFLWIHSPHFTGQIDPGRSKGVPHISSRQVEAAQIFVPALAEQRRIVAKVDELMTLCDQLEASIDAASTTRPRLLDALLAEVLEGGVLLRSKLPDGAFGGSPLRQRQGSTPTRRDTPPGDRGVRHGNFLDSGGFGDAP
jgi:hypothetical protein